MAARAFYRSMGRNALRSVAAAAVVGAVATVSVASAAAAEEAKRPPPRGLQPPARQSSVIANYEERIRTMSTLERIFTTFASVWKDGEQYMTYHDFLRSLTPWQDLKSADPARPMGTDISQFFDLADTSGDGLISQAEFIFFLTLLRTPERQFRVAFRMFDEDSNGVVTFDEFVKLVRMQSRVTRGRASSRIDSKTEEAVGGALATHLFGADRKEGLSFEKFSSFLRRLQVAVLRHEFDHFDTEGKGTVDAAGFAQLLISTADLKDRSALEKRAAKLGRGGAITFSEFVAFDELLGHVGDLNVALTMYQRSGAVFTKDEFAHAARAVAGVALNPAQVDVIFALFGGANGHLEPRRFVTIMRSRHLHARSESTSRGCISGFIKCVRGGDAGDA